MFRVFILLKKTFRQWFFMDLPLFLSRFFFLFCFIFLESCFTFLNLFPISLIASPFLCHFLISLPFLGRFLFCFFLALFFSALPFLLHLSQVVSYPFLLHLSLCHFSNTSFFRFLPFLGRFLSLKLFFLNL